MMIVRNRNPDSLFSICYLLEPTLVPANLQQCVPQCYFAILIGHIPCSCMSKHLPLLPKCQVKTYVCLRLLSIFTCSYDCEECSKFQWFEGNGLLFQEIVCRQN